MTLMSISKTVILYNLSSITYGIYWFGKNKKTGKCIVMVMLPLNADGAKWKLQSHISKSGLPLLGKPLHPHWGKLYRRECQRQGTKKFYANTAEEAFEQADKFVLKELEDIDNWIRTKSNERRSE